MCTSMMTVAELQQVLSRYAPTAEVSIVGGTAASASLVVEWGESIMDTPGEWGCECERSNDASETSR